MGTILLCPLRFLKKLPSLFLYSVEVSCCMSLWNSPQVDWAVTVFTLFHTFSDDRVLVTLGGMGMGDSFSFVLICHCLEFLKVLEIENGRKELQSNSVYYFFSGFHRLLIIVSRELRVLIHCINQNK